VLSKAVVVVEAIVSVAVVVTVVMLFANSPTAPPAAPAEAVTAAGGIDGAALYGASCAGCHGGDGSGGLGPPLTAVAEKFQDPADQVLVVTAGRGNMPAFGERLSSEEIAAVVEYTRTVLAA
jgi:mono/diheme cytochrome c family protein